LQQPTDRLPDAAPLVSVIVPTVRIDADFRAAIASLTTQTVTEIEIVIVIDGAADGHEQELEQFADDDRFRVVLNGRQLGTPVALNRGVAVARGEYIARLDADDLAEPDRLAEQLAVFADNPDLVLVGSSATLIDDGGARIGQLDVPVEGAERVLLRRNAFVHSSVLMRRDALDLVGGYDERCNRMQDYELWLRLAQVGAVENVPMPLVSYRVHPGMHSRRTPAFGAAARAVLRSRVELARHLGRSPVLQHLENAVWTGAQLLRSLRLRRPRYLVGT
jgi:glycosyltransferase involved in cell wall biosynthesis